MQSKIVSKNAKCKMPNKKCQVKKASSCLAANNSLEWKQLAVTNELALYSFTNRIFVDQ